MKRFASVVTTLALGTMTPLVVSATSFADGGTGAATPDRGIGIRLLDASVQRRHDPRAQIYIDDFVNPGASIVRHVSVSDLTPKPVHLLMYAAPATISQENFQIGLYGQRSELTSWVTVLPSTLDLTPGQSATVTVKVAVPASASKGERYGAIIAELPAAAPRPGTVSVATRVGIRMYLDVGNGGEPASNFTISTLTPERLSDGTPAVAAKVTNTGGRALDLGGTLSLSEGPGGLRAGPYNVQNLRTLGIGQTGDVLVMLDKQTPAGPWLAKLLLQSGYVSHTVTGRITFPANAGTISAPVKAVPLVRNRNVVVPVALGLIGLALLGLILFLLWRRRRRDEDEDQQSATPPRLPGQRVAADEQVHQ